MPRIVSLIWGRISIDSLARAVPSASTVTGSSTEVTSAITTPGALPEGCALASTARIGIRADNTAGHTREEVIPATP